MKRGQILIDIEKNMSSVSLIEDGRLNEFYVEEEKVTRLTGNIYKGRVINILQGLESVFIDIGLGRNAFLYVGENGEEKNGAESAAPIVVKPDLKEGDYIMVQVIKEETPLKGARLSTNISLPARYIVYLPESDFIGVSNKITDEKTREKLTNMLTKLRDQGEGAIARTNSPEAKKSDIASEIKQMRRLYKEIKQNYDDTHGVGIVHSEGNLIIRTVRDMLSKNIDAVICNDRNTVDELKGFFKRQKSDYGELVKYYESEYDMADVFKVDAELQKLVERKVELTSGATLIIEKTEALTAIDVNTARFKGSLDLGHEETVFLTNLEAAKEIARQIRLRNIGGIIIIDFIDMTESSHREAVVEALRKETAPDRIKTRVLDMTELGLVEIARKKVGRELSSYLLDYCAKCGGNAVMLSAGFMTKKLKSSLKRLFADYGYENAVVSMDAFYVEQIFAQRALSAECQIEWADKRIYLVPRDGAMTVTGSNAVSLNLPHNARLLY